MRNSLTTTRLFGAVSRRAVTVVEHAQTPATSEPIDIGFHSRGEDYGIWLEWFEFKPQLDVLGIVVPGKLIKAQRRPDGQYVAYYDHIVINRSTKHTEVTTHLYGYDRGIKFCIKRFPTRHYPL